MRFSFFLLLTLILSLSSCVPLSKITYLQQPEGYKNNDIVSVKRKQEPYRIKVNDVLNISIKSLDREGASMFNFIEDERASLSGSGGNSSGGANINGFNVNEKGFIRIPTFGELYVLNKTLDEVHDDLKKGLLDDFFNEDANIFVRVLLLGIRFVINGEIGSPGAYFINRNQATLMEAIAMSGDINITGDKTDVVIIREYPEGKKIHHIDLTIIDAINSPYYYIKPNDLILINPLLQKSLGIGTTGLGTVTTILSLVSVIGTVILLFKL